MTDINREALADVIHASHRKWCLLDKRCPEAPLIADAVIAHLSTLPVEPDALADPSTILRERDARVWDAALAHVQALADPAWTIEIIRDRELVTLQDIEQALTENPYRAQLNGGNDE